MTIDDAKKKIEKLKGEIRGHDRKYYVEADPEIPDSEYDKLMKELDYGRGYRYAHDEEGRVADMDCLPDSLKGRRYFQPTQEGREKLLAQRMDEIHRLRTAKRTKA